MTLALLLLLAQRNDPLELAPRPPALSQSALLLLRLRATERADGTTAMEEALERKLVALAAAQRPDGLWSDDLSVNALVLLAFAGAGYESAVEPHARTVRRGITGLLRREDEWGLEVRRLAIVAAALTELETRRSSPSLRAASARAKSALLARRGSDGGWGDSAVTLWARLAWHLPNVHPRPALTSEAPEHQAFMAFYEDRRWKIWLEKARPRLLADVEGVEATARQAIDLATPYRFRSFSLYDFNSRSS